MKNCFQFFLLASLFICVAGEAQEYSDREFIRSLYREYSPDELSKTGQEWLDFCQKEKELLSVHKVKFSKFIKISKDVADESESNDLEVVSVGGVKLSLPINSEMNLIETNLESEDFYYALKLEDDDEYISISRSKVIDITSSYNNDEPGVELVRKLFSDRKITDISIMHNAYSLAPSDIKCISSTENIDKRALFVLGGKTEPVHLIELEQVMGYALIDKYLEPGKASMNLTFESNDSVYSIAYISMSDDIDDAYIRKFISKTAYLSDVESYQIELNAEFQSVNKQLEKILNKQRE